MISNDEADGDRLEPLSAIHTNSQSSIVAAAGHGDCVSRFCEAESADRAEQDYWMSSTPVLKHTVDAASDEFPGSGVPILTSGVGMWPCGSARCVESLVRQRMVNANRFGPKC